MLCTIQASALRHCPSSHISSTAYCLSASHVLLSAAASILAPSSRHALSANGGLRVHQDIRQHVVEVSVHALRCATCRCKHPCDGASAAGAIHASTSAALLQVRLGRRTVMDPAKARRRHVDFSGVLRPRKSTSEKSTRSDPRHARRLKVIIKSPRRAAGIFARKDFIHTASNSRLFPLRGAVRHQETFERCYYSSVYPSCYF
jgi:hypothetical protein